MPEIREKRVSDSHTQQVQIIMPSDINGFDRVFGGRLMEWIDIVSGVVSRRHSNCNTTTIFVDNLHFKQPAHVNSTIVLDGRVTYVGNTSMEVRVDTFVESLTGEKVLVNRAYLVMVALDENEIPTRVPRLVLESEEEKAEWEAAKIRNKHRLERKDL